MSEIRHVRIEYDDKVMWIEGEEALKWQKHTDGLAILASIHGMNSFEHDPIKWNIVEGCDRIGI